MLETCFSTALPVTTSSRAIAAFVRPSAISSSTSRSRGVSASSALPGGAGRAAPEELGDDLAVQAVPPSATRRTASTNARASPTRSLSR